MRYITILCMSPLFEGRGVISGLPGLGMSVCVRVCLHRCVSKMADRLVAFLTVCAVFVLLGDSSVVTAAVNARMNNRSKGFVSNLRRLTKEAFRAGKIQLS